MNLSNGIVILGLLGVASCGPTGLEPTGLKSRDGVEEEVLALIDSSIASVLRDTVSPEAHRHLAWSFEANGFWDEASRSYAATLSLDPSDHLSRFHRSIALREIGRADEAFSELQMAASQLQNVPAVQYRLGLDLLEVGLLDEATNCFNAVMAHRPKAPHGPYGLGLVAQANAKPKVARTHFERALKVAPGEQRIQFALGQVHRTLGQVDLAKTYLTRGAGGAELKLSDPFTAKIEELGRSRAARLDRAARLHGMGQFDRSVGILRKILAEDPGDKTAMTNLSGALVAAERYDEALQVIDEHLTQDPLAPEAYHHRSLVHGARGDINGAVRAAARAAELAPNLAAMRQQYGIVLAQAGIYSEAYSQMSEANRLGAGGAAIQRELARLCQLQELPAMAAEHFRASLLIEPLDPVVHLNLVIALGDMGRNDEALAALIVMRGAVPGHKALDKAAEYLEFRSIR